MFGADAFVPLVVMKAATLDLAGDLRLFRDCAKKRRWQGSHLQAAMESWKPSTADCASAAKEVNRVGGESDKDEEIEKEDSKT